MESSTPSELESTICYIKRILEENRKSIFWSFVALFVSWMMLRIETITVLLFTSYAIAILLDPVLSKMRRFGFSRSFSILLIGGLFLLSLLAILLFAVPQLVNQYIELISAFPHYIKTTVEKSIDFANTTFGFKISISQDRLIEKIRSYLSAVSVEQLKIVFNSMSQTIFKGYSLTITIFNLFLLPLFVFYFARDLSDFHGFISRLMPEKAKIKVAEIGTEILGHVHAFFKGQLTVSLLMALFYIFGLVLIGLPSGFLLGALAGILNIVPYLGVGLGVVLATIIALMGEGGTTQMFMVWGIFISVQLLEGLVLTPKIVGESVGIHPLIVMIALIIGGELFGLFGLVIAIPLAAALRVLFKYGLQAID